MKTKTTAFLFVATLLAAHLWMRRANTDATPVAQDKSAAIDRMSAKIQEAANLKNGKKLNYARGLYVDSTSRGQLVWHVGSAAGYKTAVGRLPEHRLSIAIACNAGEAADDGTKFAAQVLDLFVPGNRR